MKPWHPPVEQLREWVAGTAAPLIAASVDQHVPACAACRDVVAGAAGTAHLDTVWRAIRDRIEPQPLNLVGRVLVRAGMTRRNAFLVSAAPTLSGAWIPGVTPALLFAVVAAGISDTRGVTVFLLAAPLAPLAGIGFAFDAETDPLYELTLAAPYSKFVPLLSRSAAVLTTTIPITVIAALAIQASWWIAAAWLVPALAFCTVTLALTRWLHRTSRHIWATGRPTRTAPPEMRSPGAA